MYATEHKRRLHEDAVPTLNLGVIAILQDIRERGRNSGNFYLLLNCFTLHLYACTELEPRFTHA